MRKVELEAAHEPIRVITFVEFLYDLTTAASNGKAYGDILREELEKTTWPEKTTRGNYSVFLIKWPYARTSLVRFSGGMDSLCTH